MPKHVYESYKIYHDSYIFWLRGPQTLYAYCGASLVPLNQMLIQRSISVPTSHSNKVATHYLLYRSLNTAFKGRGPMVYNLRTLTTLLLHLFSAICNSNPLFLLIFICIQMTLLFMCTWISMAQKTKRQFQHNEIHRQCSVVSRKS